MGDRRNVKVVDNNNTEVYLYTHWGGYNLPLVVQETLARRERWDDAPYLARMIFCAMMGGDQHGSTGFGISANLQDTNYPGREVEIYTSIKEITIGKNSWTFEEFIELDVNFVAGL